MHSHHGHRHGSQPEHHAHDHHGHAHHHGHGNHHHAPAVHRAFIPVIVLNIGFVAVEAVYGFIANSTALMADAGHNLSDVLGLLLAWAAAHLAKRPPAGSYTYGLRGASILAALANAMLLLLACGVIGWEAVHRFLQPSAVDTVAVSVVAGIGIVINGISAWMFMAGSKDDLNIRGAYLHMLADAAVSAGVVVSGLAMFHTGWYWLDPAVSLIVVAVVVFGTWSLLRDAARLSLGAVPQHIDLQTARRFLLSQPGVAAVQDLHIWGMSTTETALTAFLIMPGGHPGDRFLQQVSHGLKQQFAIHHATLQIMQHAAADECALEH